MGYRTTFIFILLMLVLSMFGLVFWITSGVIWVKILTSVFIFCLIIFLFFFYYRLVRPMKIIENGMDLLQAQDFSSRLSSVGQKEADHLIAIFNRMMEQLKNERLLVREKNSFLDLLINASPMGVVILDFDHNITEMNPASLELLGVERKELFLNRPLSEVSKDFSINLAAVEPSSVKTMQLTNANIIRCSHLSFIDRGFKHPFFLIESLTDEVRLAEKKAYEKVIRMIAHEVNNTTAGVTSTLESLRGALETVQGSKDLREAIEVCTDRSLNMSRFITKFADVVKIPQPQLVKSNLNELVKQCICFMQPVCNEQSITIVGEGIDEPFEVFMDPLLMEQVLVNIIKNSVESIGEQGNIAVRLFSESSCVTVEDDGPGIAPELESKIFNPFFSSKPNGQGIGLLFIREVLSRHHCKFSLHTDSDGITRFKIEFDN